jgi:hypothetical protein
VGRHSLQITGDDLIPDPPLRTQRSFRRPISKAPLGIRYSFGRKRGDDVLSNFYAGPMLRHAENGKKKVIKRKSYER